MSLQPDIVAKTVRMNISWRSSQQAVARAVPAEARFHYQRVVAHHDPGHETIIRDMTLDLAACRGASSAGKSLPCDLAEQHEPCRAHWWATISTDHVLLFVLLRSLFHQSAAVRVVLEYHPFNLQTLNKHIKTYNKFLRVLRGPPRCWFIALRSPSGSLAGLYLSNPTGSWTRRFRIDFGWRTLKPSPTLWLRTVAPLKHSTSTQDHLFPPLLY